MLNDWTFIGIFLLMAAIFPGVPILLNSLVLGPKKNNPVKNSAYECGIETVGETWVQFKVQYYIFALVFVVFDVETVFLFPFAVAFQAVPLFAVFEAVLFILILAGALVYAWRKGALEWV
jgi:NADH:ubiquinone oxidoreductase subunit 3 (subunit A)